MDEIVIEKKNYNGSEISLGDFGELCGVANDFENVNQGGRACKKAFSEAGAYATNVNDNGGKSNWNITYGPTVLPQDVEGSLVL